MNSIEIRGLKKSFGGTPVLRDINLTVAQGSVHGFLGPNGSGKTTTIKVILGLYKADAGEIRLFERPVSTGGMKSLLADIGYLPQDPVFPEQYTGIEVMELIASLYHVPQREKDQRIKDLLKRFDLQKAGNRPAKNYSRGMKQRLGLATVWLPCPKLIILDEPLSALDPEGRFDVLEHIKELKGESTVFFSSHILSDVERVSDKITIIGEGNVLLEDSMENIRGTYVSSAYLLRVPFDRLPETGKILADIAEITEVTGEANNLLLQTNSENVATVGKKVLAAVLKADIPVIRFSLQEATLEDVFLQLINGGAA